MPRAFHIVVMGVSGAGKTTVGRILAHELSKPFLDADDFHPEANVSLMRSGIALTDADREPWLHALVKELDRHPAGAVLACSALKHEYRVILATARLPLRIVFLDGPRELISRRLTGRVGHYMPPALLDSQLEALEPPEESIRIPIDGTPGQIVQTAVKALGH